MQGKILRSAFPASIALVALLALVAVAPSAADDTASGYDAYHTFAEIEARLQGWARQHPERVRVASIGESAGGRKLWVAEIAADGPRPPAARPAVFVGANIAGDHNAGSEAALDLIGRLLEGGEDTGGLLAATTFYVAPALNPDAHDALFATPRVRRQGADGRLDRDLDGLAAEDGFDDLDGDGRITGLRVPDPAGGWLPHPEEGRLMVRADPARGWAGAFRLESEGSDDDRDGAFNEDPPFGVAPDRNFAHAFPYHQPEAGPWASFAPEARAVMDFLLGRRNVALAVVYGPANNLLAAPESLGGGGDLGTQRFTVPPEAAEFMGLDPEAEYTLDEVWEVAKDLPFVRQNNITKEMLAQFLGAGPATRVADEDQALLSRFAKAYEKRLEAAGLDTDRPAEQYRAGGFTPWLYYQYGVPAIELDVWGIPRPVKEPAEAAEGAAAPLTLERLEAMSSEEFLALSRETVAAFLEEIGAPAEIRPEGMFERVESGQVTPAQMAEMARSMGAGAGGGGAGGDADKDSAEIERQRQVLAWVNEHAPWAVAPWTAVTLADGSRAEAGGLDPFIAVAPPYALLEPALAVHTDTVLDLAAKLPRLEITAFTARDLGGGVYRVRAVAANRGELPTHGKMGERAQSHRPVRLELAPAAGAELITGRRAVASERLERGATLEAEWLVRADRGAAVEAVLTSDHAGGDRRQITLTPGREKRGGKTGTGYELKLYSLRSDREPPPNSYPVPV